MAEVVLTATPYGVYAYRLSWPSSGAGTVYYCYRDGALAFETAQLSWVVSVAPGESPVFQVFDSSTDVPTYATPGYLVLHWLADTTARYYRVDRYVTDAWVEQTKISESGLGYYTWQTPVLDDATTHQFRIVSVGANGVEGDYQAITVLIARHPTPPAITATYAPLTGLVTLDD